MTTTDREATRVDRADMVRIWALATKERAGRHYTREQVARLSPSHEGPAAIPDAEFESDDRHAVVAVRDGAVVGWGSVDLADAVLAATFVVLEHGGECVGRAMVERLEAAACERGTAALAVQASLGAEGFFAALGYERVREVDVGDQEGPAIPGVEMRTRLQ